MSNIEVSCPKCGEAFELTEALAAPLLEAERQKVDTEVQRRVQAEMASVAAKAKVAAENDAAVKVHAAELLAEENAQKLREAQAQELTIRKERELLAQQMESLELTVQRRVDEEKDRAAEKARADAGRDWQVKLDAAERDLAAKDAKLRDAEQAEINARKLKLEAEEAMRQTELTVARRVEEEMERTAEKVRADAERDWKAKLAVAEQDLAAKDAKLRDAEQAEINARKLKLEAEEAMRQTELTVARRIDEELVKVRDSALRERDEEYRLKLGDKDKQLDDMRQQIEELRRKGERMPQQLAGDVLELDLMDVLSHAFPHDHFERVKKGQSGADLLQTVRTPSGQICGRVLWETKRTKNWTDGWLSKLREDQRGVKADVAGLVTETLPEGTVNFDLIDGIWVSSIGIAVPMAVALRHGLMDTARARAAAEGAGTKKDLVYSYLTGAEFRQRVHGMVEPIVEMRDSLTKEKVLLNRQWNTREKQLERAMINLAHLYGDLHGIVGNSLPVVDGLSFPSLEAPGEDSSPNSAANQELLEVDAAA